MKMQVTQISQSNPPPSEWTRQPRQVYCCDIHSLTVEFILILTVDVARLRAHLLPPETRQKRLGQRERGQGKK